MSAKWHRSKRWDEQHLRGRMLAPLRWLLRAFSSITLSVVLLSLIAIYGTLASVPIGLLALGPTWAVIGLAVVLSASLPAVLIGAGVRRCLPKPRHGLRFAATLIGGLFGAVGGAWAWKVWAWPALRFDPVSGNGMRLFAGFVERYEDITLRRLPGIELTELEFYAAWPFKLLLILFVTNMVVATVRRIEFGVKNAGVLTVHSGIVFIAMSSLYYQALKQEGDTILLAGTQLADGTSARGPAQTHFYDATRVAIWTRQLGQVEEPGRPQWEQKLIRGLPRYNTYGSDAGSSERDATLLSEAFSRNAAGDPASDRGRSLSINLSDVMGSGDGDQSVDVRVVGYAPYAELRDDVVLFSRGQVSRQDRVDTARPVRAVELHFPPESEVSVDRPVLRFTLAPDDPAQRAKSIPGFGFELTRGLDTEQWAALTLPTPAGASDVLVVTIPGIAPPVAIPARAGEAYAIGRTGWEVGVRALLEEPPFPIVTPGYEGADSGVAILRITQPDGQAFDRWVYSRYPEISQDLLPGTSGDGRPVRREADPAIRIAYLDLQLGLNVHIDEVSLVENDEPRWRAAIRKPDGTVRTVEGIAPGDRVRDVMPKVDIVIDEGWADSRPIERPIEVPPPERESRFIGTHDMAKVALEVRVAGPGDGTAWTRVVWLPFTRYMGLSPGTIRTIELPDGRRFELAFGRYQREFSSFALRLVDFEMIAHDFRGAPRDYQSLIEVQPLVTEGDPAFDAYEHVAKLNAPLRAPYLRDDRRSTIMNVILRLASGLNPSQYKISQAGWDQAGWSETQELADQGVIPAPHARFTIMQVGNNPGIHLVAAGGVMIALGIPWAFYVKPWMVRREKLRLAAGAQSRRDRSHSPDTQARRRGADAG